MADTLSHYKQQAAERAVEFVKSGMLVGLGHGSTAIFALQRLAELLQQGSLQDIVGIPCSLQVEAEAHRLSIPLTKLSERLDIDLTIDGADEIDPRLNVIKGGGGALLREKIVAQASRRMIIVADYTKLSPALGTHFSVPLEVVPFGWRSQARFLESLGGRWSVRQKNGGGDFLTDQGNLIIDCAFGSITQPEELAEKLQARAGILEHGLFLHLATEAIVAGPQGVERLVPTG